MTRRGWVPLTLACLLAALAFATPTRAQHRDRAGALASPWGGARGEARPQPPGSPHFVFELAGGFLAPLLDARPYAQLVFGIEALAGVVRIRVMIGCAFEGVVESAPLPFRGTLGRQGGVVPMARFTLGGDLAPWLGLRVAAGVGATYWTDVRPAADAALELFARLTDERRLEVGVSGGPSLRYLSFPDPSGRTVDWTLEPAARLAVFVGGVL